MAILKRLYPVILLLVSLSIFTNGCITTQEKVMKSWVDHSTDELIEKWGGPNSDVKLENGKRVLTWTSVWNDDFGNIQTCRKSFTADSNRIIKKWSYRNCPVIQWSY